ncbi:hypothetical protein YB2330_005714 [Saitoella coloradoensis]
MSYPEHQPHQQQHFNGVMSESLPEHTLPPHYDYHTSRPPTHRQHSSLLSGVSSMPPPTSSIHQSQQHQSLLRRAEPVIQQYDILGRRKPKSPREPHSWSPAQDALLRRLKEKEGMGWREIALYFPGRTSNGCQFRWRRLSGGKLKSQQSSSSLTPLTPLDHKPTSHQPTSQPLIRRASTGTSRRSSEDCSVGSSTNGTTSPSEGFLTPPVLAHPLGGVIPGERNAMGFFGHGQSNLTAGIKAWAGVGGGAGGIGMGMGMGGGQQEGTGVGMVQRSTSESHLARPLQGMTMRGQQISAPLEVIEGQELSPPYQQYPPQKQEVWKHLARAEKKEPEVAWTREEDSVIFTRVKDLSRDEVGLLFPTRSMDEIKKRMDVLNMYGR